MNTLHPNLNGRMAPLLAWIGCLTVTCAVSADVPTYRVEVVAPYAVTTTLRGASEAGHMVGDQVLTGQGRAFVATQVDGLAILPLPDGYDASTALDVNRFGVVVGAVATSSPFDGGEPAVWTPDGNGGYDVQIPEQFTSLPSPLGELTISGGMAVAINDAGIIAGWSRFQGFQGGPTTLFSLNGPPIDARELGFEATVRDLSNGNELVGGSLRLDLDTGTVTDLGVPPPSQPGGIHFTHVIAFAVNDHGETVVAANLATSSTNWLTYTHRDGTGFAPLDPSQLPYVFVGFYDNNNRGDVSATGGVLFADEGVLTTGYDGLLDPIDGHWDTLIGFIANNRRVYTTAIDNDSGGNALVVLIPDSVFSDGFESGTTMAWDTIVRPGIDAWHE